MPVVFSHTFAQPVPSDTVPPPEASATNAPSTQSEAPGVTPMVTDAEPAPGEVLALNPVMNWLEA
jgi:hypothetical protein